MTFSILARNPRTGAIGCAAATGNLAVGGWVPRVAADAGAVATQGMAVSSLWGDDALRSLRRGYDAERTIAEIVGLDEGRDHRQLAVLDLEGGGAVWTGAANRDFKGHLIGPDLVIAGNWLMGARVLDAMHERYRTSPEAGDLAGFAAILLAALQTGAEAGGDARGLFSAAIRICARHHAPLDLRIDHGEAPIERLAALVETATNPPYSDWSDAVPSLDRPYRY